MPSNPEEKRVPGAFMRNTFWRVVLVTDVRTIRGDSQAKLNSQSREYATKCDGESDPFSVPAHLRMLDFNRSSRRWYSILGGWRPSGYSQPFSIPTTRRSLSLALLWDDVIASMENGSRNRRVGKKIRELIQL
jgi:hypothetical protein